MLLGCPKDEHFSYFQTSCQLGLSWFKLGGYFQFGLIFKQCLKSLSLNFLFHLEKLRNSKFFLRWNQKKTTVHWKFNWILELLPDKDELFWEVHKIFIRIQFGFERLELNYFYSKIITEGVTKLTKTYQPAQILNWC